MIWYISATVAAIILFLIFLIFLNRWLLYHITEKRIHNFQSELIAKYYDEVQNMYQQVRGWRHDYHNHVQMMKAYLSQGQYQQLDAYLDQLTTDLSTVDTVIKTGNVMVDAILNSKISIAKSRQIAINAKAIVPKQFECSDLELCIVVGNLMDNAIEACMELSNPADRFIRIYLDVIKGKFYLCITNSMNRPIHKVHGKYRTTKTEEGHGFGLARIDSIVSKYGGCINRQHEEGIFSTEVILPLQIS